MFRFREITVRLCGKVFRTGRVPEPQGNAGAAHAAAIAKAIRVRESQGYETTLRHLHNITQLSQPEALRAAAELERSKMIIIERDLHDVLQSRLELTAEMRQNLDEIAHSDAA
ncbi:hypothetical protein [Erythrobacter rubeus]|uniref:Uncharacterized protein n=1 Tax=Erythrobacter rubeus TaxID=2760803 RepID=A0ABR8KPQ7_9SPHN|nr:hypothetical protein [Erythrobacter rubeus]MBD2841859.1 hypothetical protein [Erythrobacter rubeus]